MHVRRPSRPIMSLVAVGLALAAAQSGSGSRRCVGSEKANPRDQPDPRRLHGGHGARIPNQVGHRPALDTRSRPRLPRMVLRSFYLI